ncbi:MAG TPA: sterol desaturase family protein [Nannocystaceae bacterium]|nr:sterol desaturase family protein [Nannocystaceae bacterium]
MAEAAQQLDAGPADVARPRRDTFTYRDETVLRDFSLRKHLVQVLGIASVFLGIGLWLARDAAALAWLMFPVFLLIANVFEWGIHRFLMHRPLQPRILYTNHALVHHRAFEGALMEIREVRELSLVMMPWYTLIFVFVLASPVAITAAIIAGPAMAGVFLVAAVTYFLLYEIIHTLHHLTPATLARIPLGSSGMVAALRRHHHHHHQHEHMAKVNFNVTFPLADAVLGTYEATPR